MRKTISQLFSGLRFRLLLLVVLACAPLVGLTLHTASEERRRLVKDWNQRSQEMMELATREEGQVIGQTRQLLLALAESSPVRSGNRRDCKKLLDAVRQLPALCQFGSDQDQWNGSGQRAPDDGTGQPSEPSVLPTRARHARLLHWRLPGRPHDRQAHRQFRLSGFRFRRDRSRPWSSPRWIWTGSTVPIMRSRCSCPKGPPGPRSTATARSSCVIPHRKSGWSASLCRKSRF